MISKKTRVLLPLVLGICLVMLIVQHDSVTYDNNNKKNTTHFSDFGIGLSTISDDTLPLCPIFLPHLNMDSKLKLENISMGELDATYQDFFKNAHSTPKHCKAKVKTAIIIPFRERHRHLGILLNNLIPLLTRQLRDFKIFVMEQAPGGIFNKALMMNAGFAEAMKHDKFDCFIFQDVDKIPLHERIPYECLNNRSYHLASHLSSFDYRFRVSFAGGVLATPANLFKAINGFSNLYFGWGFEDDDMNQRLRRLNGEPIHTNEEIGKFYCIEHERDEGNPVNKNGLTTIAGSWTRAGWEGLSTVHYNIDKSEIRPLFVWNTVSFDPDKIRQQFKEELNRRQGHVNS